jgi:hypothetical protein
MYKRDKGQCNQPSSWPLTQWHSPSNTPLQVGTRPTSTCSVLLVFGGWRLGARSSERRASAFNKHASYEMGRHRVWDSAGRIRLPDEIL